MAINPTYANSPVLSKVKLGSTIYYLKDADLRGIVGAFGNATAQDVATSIGENVTGLATGIQVYEYVNQKTADLAGAMHFVAGTRAEQTSPKAGDVVIEGVIEYVYDGKAWQELGDEGTWVPKSRKVAGIDLVDDITVAELESALSLKALAKADTASVTLNDYVTGLNGVEYTPEGSITIDSSSESANATVTKGDLSISATVAGSTTAAGTVTITADSEGTEITGTNSSSNVTVTPTTAAFVKGYKENKAPTAASFDVSKFNAGGLTKGTAVTAATEGVVAAIDTTDTEMLVFTAAGTDQVMDYEATFTAPSMASDIFTANTVGELDTANAMTGVESATAAAQTFTGGKFKATFSGTSSTVTGTATQTIENGVVDSVSYIKTTIGDSSSFSGTKKTITPTLTTGEKKITVTPDTTAPSGD